SRRCSVPRWASVSRAGPDGAAERGIAALPAIRVEARLEIADDGAPRGRDEIGPLPGYDSIRLRARRIRTTYLDTAEWTLWRAGISLVVQRIGRKASLEARWPGSLEEGVRRQRIVEAPVDARKLPSRLPAGAVSLYLAPFVARRRLVPIAELEVR